MASNKYASPVSKRAWVVMSVLAAGLVVSIFALDQRTQTQQQASQGANLNVTDPTLQGANPDGTMGPPTANLNFSGTLPLTAQNALVVKVGSTKPATPTSSGKGNGNGKNKENKPNNQTPALTSLVLTISKAEVHLAQFIPPANLNTLPSGIVGQVPTKDSNPKGNPNKVTGADKWEVLELDGERNFDLVALSKTNVADTFGITSLACGRYTEIRLYVKKAVATFEGSELEVPVAIPGNAGVVRIVRPFVITKDKPVELFIEFDAEKSVVKAGSNYILKPVVARVENR